MLRTPELILRGSVAEVTLPPPPPPAPNKVVMSCMVPLCKIFNRWKSPEVRPVVVDCISLSTLKSFAGCGAEVSVVASLDRVGGSLKPKKVLELHTLLACLAQADIFEICINNTNIRTHIITLD